MPGQERATLTEADAVYVQRAAERYARRNAGDAEEIAQRILARVPWIVAARVGAKRWAAVRAVSVSNAIADIDREDRAQKRGEPCEALPPSGVADPIGRLSQAELTSLRIDLEIGLAREGERVRELCELLKVVSIAEAARIMGISRSTATGWIASLRERLEAKGLKAYVRD